MGATTGISWADATCNLWRSCEEVSPACDHCYAREMAKRNPKVLGKWGSYESGGTRVVAAEDYWEEPRKWNKSAQKEGVRKRVFCLSMGDFFEEWPGPMVSTSGMQLWKRDDGSWTTSDHYSDTVMLTMQDVRKRAFKLMDDTPWLDWLILTKRPQNIGMMLTGSRAKLLTAPLHEIGTPEANIWYRPNVWLGTTCENQEQADKRIPELLKCRDLSPVLWLSCEPLLGPINFTDMDVELDAWPQNAWQKSKGLPSVAKRVMNPLNELDWMITGGESGSKARPMHPQWARSLRDQCNTAGVPFHFKQWGEWLAADGLPDGDDRRQGREFVYMNYEGQVTGLNPEMAPMSSYRIIKVGTKKSGRLLDGVLHDAIPSVHQVPKIQLNRLISSPRLRTFGVG